MVALRTQNLISAAMIACAFAFASSMVRFPGVNAEVAQDQRGGDCEVSRALEVSSTACSTSESSEDFVNTMIEEFVTVSIAMVLGFGALHSLKTSMMHHANDSKAPTMTMEKHEDVLTSSMPPAEESSSSSSELVVPNKHLEVDVGRSSSSPTLDHSDASTVAGDSDGHAGDSDSNADDSDVEEAPTLAAVVATTTTTTTPKWDDKLSWRHAAALEHERLKHCVPPMPTTGPSKRQSRLAKPNVKASTTTPVKPSGPPTLSAGGLALLSLLREEQRTKLMCESSGNAEKSCTPPGLAVPACSAGSPCSGPIRPPPGLEAFGPKVPIVA